MGIQLKRVKVKNEEISPKVLTAALFSRVEQMPKGYALKERYVYDYEFEFILYSDGASMIIDDKHYELKEGDVIYRKPGQYTQGFMPYTCYLVAVDMLNNTRKSPSSYYVYNRQDFQNYCINDVLEKIPQIFQPLNKEKTRYLFETIFKEFITPTEISDLSLKTKVLELMCYLYQNSTDPFKNNTIPMSSPF